MYFQRLRDLREDRDMNQTQVAALLQISQTVGRDKNGNPYFNVPPLLDKWDDGGTPDNPGDDTLRPLDLVYYKLGARPQEYNTYVAQNISEFKGNKNNEEGQKSFPDDFSHCIHTPFFLGGNILSKRYGCVHLPGNFAALV